MTNDNFVVCFGYERLKSMTLHCLVKNAANGWGHIIPFNRLWNLIVVCVTLGCIMNKQHNMVILSHWYYQLLRHRHYVTFMQVSLLIARLTYYIVMLPCRLHYTLNCWCLVTDCWCNCHKQVTFRLVKFLAGKGNLLCVGHAVLW